MPTNVCPTSVFYGETKRDGSMLDSLARVYGWTAIAVTYLGLAYISGITPWA